MKHVNGIFLARMQPLHNAHLYMVEKMISECEHVHVFLGSENKKDMLRNPFTIDLRERMLMESLSDNTNVHVYTIPDWSTESDLKQAKEWGRYFYYNVVSRIGAKTFAIYYSDNPSIMLNWFEDYLQDRIQFEFSERNTIFEGLSATKIREAFKKNDLDYIKKYCPHPVVTRFGRLKAIWERVTENPQNDFSME